MKLKSYYTEGFTTGVDIISTEYQDYEGSVVQSSGYVIHETKPQVTNVPSKAYSSSKGIRQAQSSDRSIV
jgi:hypothetical protein